MGGDEVSCFHMNIDEQPITDVDQFIVDNRANAVTAGQFLTEWCKLASSLDIATGYFDTKAFDSLSPAWESLEKIRLLMGSEVTSGVKSEILAAVKQRVLNQLEHALDDSHQEDPLMKRASKVQEAIVSGKIEAKVFAKSKFHAKAYLTTGNEALPTHRALVGSSNFTQAGLNRNIELNVQIHDSDRIAELQKWYKSHWDEAEDIKEELLQVLQHHTREVSPFEIYGRALNEFFVNETQTANEWEDQSSSMFKLLDDYQKEGYWQVVNIAKRFNGALLCDGVGLGKTFIGLMLIERLVEHEKKNVILLSPKSVKEGVWTEELAKRLPALAGMDGFQDFSNLTVLSHTDLRKSHADRIRRLIERADAIVIDEAHHFRNPGKLPVEGANVEDMSRWWQLFAMANKTKVKPVYMLTATPINNSLQDFKNLISLFTQRNDAYFKETLGVNSVSAEIIKIERAINARMAPLEHGQKIEAPTDDIYNSPLFENLVVQRSRNYAKKSQRRQYGKTQKLVFPEREKPRVANYSLAETYGDLFEIFEKAMDHKRRGPNGELLAEPLFRLPIYSQVDYALPGVDLSDLEKGRRKQIVELIRISFMKRFESSVYSFERSSAKLLLKVLAFIKANVELADQKTWLESWAAANDDLYKYINDQLLVIADESDEEEYEEDDADILESLDTDDIEALDRTKFDVDKIIEDSKSDVELLTTFIRNLMKFGPKDDDKLQSLITSLTSEPELVGKKVMIFTEFSDTARYIHKHLKDAGIEKLEFLDSKSKSDRAGILRRFSPYYNRSSLQQLDDDGATEIDVLVATDVLSEGLNLQDATRLINYDIHWNPVRLMQRIGRVDRRLNPEIEKELKAAYPERANERGRIVFWNFLPPKELKQLLSLWHKVRSKTAYISFALGLEAPILHPDDHYNSLKEYGIPTDFDPLYDGRFSDNEKLKLEWQSLREDYPEAFQVIDKLPNGSFSGKIQDLDLEKGIFFCIRVPGLNVETNTFTYETGTTEWLLWDITEKKVLGRQGANLAPAIRAGITDARVISNPDASWSDETESIWHQAWKSVKSHLHNTTLRNLMMPLDAPDPKLICWMELN
jgi:superfamily II DNA or RNA helicase